jgi:probable rRNA maturation factor
MSIEVNNESGHEVDEAEFAALARFVLDAMHLHPQTDLSIMLVDTEVMTDLHIKWMD